MHRIANDTTTTRTPPPRSPACAIRTARHRADVLDGCRRPWVANGWAKSVDEPQEAPAKEAHRRRPNRKRGHRRQ
jgi:hypothetical protein